MCNPAADGFEPVALVIAHDETYLNQWQSKTDGTGTPDHDIADTEETVAEPQSRIETIDKDIWQKEGRAVLVLDDLRHGWEWRSIVAYVEETTDVAYHLCSLGFGISKWVKQRRLYNTNDGPEANAA